MKLFPHPFLAFILSLLLTGCFRNPSNEVSGNVDGKLSGKITLTGSSTIAPLITEISRRFEEQHPAVRIDVQTGGSGKGIADTRMGIAEIGMASRSLKADEADLITHQIAADGVGLIVHSSNPIKDLTAEQVISIYTNQIQNWKEVGGKEGDITIVHKAEGRATLEVFLNHFEIDNTTVKPDVIVGENEHAIKTVAGTENAIGYVSIGTAEADIAAGVPIRLLPLGGVEASTATVSSGAFPMSRPLNLITTDSPSSLASEFIRYCQSPEVHDLIRSQYFIPVSSEPNVAQ
ncbi:phosphate ABC transporter substrate-binding protein [Rubinisphaera sp.]|uniref:phosphate ABC transporter substrate-binding protein n=1 Tax=Rubinisphaera sp. TaxID=2024857 RepID=UPI000C0F3C6D|nr:phosphate ABC transporter substrate-binding protein [Rubinisphaera sp.]MBV10494.1 ABC transporter substrate-binding protein [Rubinisphaera sp.]